jgi:hypothetical protein
MPAGGHYGIDQAVTEIKSQANATLSNIQAASQLGGDVDDNEPDGGGELISPVSP